MTACLAALAFVAPQNPLDAKVDFTCPASRAEVALKQLSDKAGLTFRADGDIANDVLVIRVQCVSLSELMARIATASAGRWTRKGEVEYLTASADEERRRHQIISHEEAGRIRKSLQTILSSPAMNTNWTSDDAARLAEATETAMNPPDGTLRGDSKNVQALIGRDPCARSLVRLLAAIGPDTLADKLSDGSIVYATDPNSMQVGIPPAQDTLNQFLTEEMWFVDATKAYNDLHPPGSSRFSMSGIGRGELRGGDPKKGIGKAIVRFNATYRNGGGNASAEFTDRDSKLINEGFLSVPLEARPQKVFPAVGDDGPMAVDNLAKQFRDACRVDESGPRNSMSMAVSNESGVKTLELRSTIPVRAGSLSPALSGWLRSPATNEPQRLAAGPLTMTTAIRRSENLVADVDDRCFRAALQLSAGRTTPSAWLNSTALQTDHDVTEDSGWLTVSLRDPAGARENRVNRFGLAELVASLSKLHLFSLDAISQFAQTQAHAAEEGNIDFEYMRAICPGATLTAYNSTDWPMYRFYGALTVDQRGAMTQGSGLNIAALTPSAEKALQQLVFESTEQATLVDGNGKEIDSYAKGILNDWTELLPEGVPSGTGILLKTDVQPAAYCYSTKMDVAEIASIADVARDRFVNSTPRFKEYSGLVVFDRFAEAKQSTYKFRFKFGHGIQLDRELKDGVFDASTEPQPFTSMPSDFRDGVAKEFTELNAAFGGTTFQAPTQGNPPPPAWLRLR